MRFLPVAFALCGLSLAPMQAAADCSCLCVDGTFRPICTSADEVVPNRGLCLARTTQACPRAPQAEPESFAPPVDGAENCRQAQVYDAAEGEYLPARVCDVMPEA
jgi:hypothetical protein